MTYFLMLFQENHTENPFDDELASHARNLSGSVKFCDVEGSEIDTITVGGRGCGQKLMCSFL